MRSIQSTTLVKWLFLARPMVLIAVLASTSACSVLWGDSGVFRSRGKDYLAAAAIDEITVPKELSVAAIEPLYYVPDVDVKDDFGDDITLKQYTVPRPEAMGSGNESVGVKIQKLEDDRWIFLGAPTSQVWPRTQNFLSQYNLDVVRADVEKGVIETGWITFKDDPKSESRYRILLEKGIHAETTEIHITHVQRALAGVNVTADTWPEKSHSQTREAWLLDELAQVLASNIDNASASLLGQNVGGAEKAAFLRGASEPTLNLRLPLNRAFASLSYALDQEGFTLWDESGNKDVFYVDYQLDKKSASMLSRLKPGKADVGEANKPAYNLAEVMAHLDGSDEVKSAFDTVTGAQYGEAISDAKGFLVVLNQDAGGVQVRVRDYRGKILPREHAKNMLRIMRRNLL